MKDNAPTNGDWATRDELDFLDRLGEHTQGVFLGRRVRLIRGYLAGLRLRAECPFDREVVTRKALRLLRVAEIESRRV